MIAGTSGMGRVFSSFAFVVASFSSIPKQYCRSQGFVVKLARLDYAQLF